MPGHNVHVSRRNLLQSVGVGGLAVGFGTTGNAVATSAGEGELGPEHGWVERQTAHSRNGDANVVKSAHTLAYLHATWDPVVDPAGAANGCWRHTFALTGTFVRQFRPAHGNWSLRTIGDDGVSVHVPESNGEQPLAVSARRDPALFGFLDRATFSEALVERHYELREEDDEQDTDPDQGGLLEPMRAESSNTTHSEELDVLETLTEKEYETDADWQSFTREGLSFGVGMLGEVGEELGAARLAPVASKLSYLDDFWTMGSALQTLYSGVDIPRFDLGFDVTYPHDGEHTFEDEAGMPHSAGGCGHYLVFDVYHSPSASGTVEVASAVPRDGISGAWELEFERASYYPAETDPGDRFYATAEPTDSVERGVTGDGSSTETDTEEPA